MTKTVKFNIYEGTSATVLASFDIIDQCAENVKIITKVPRGQYHSILNDARTSAEELLSSLYSGVSENECFTKTGHGDIISLGRGKKTQTDDVFLFGGISRHISDIRLTRGEAIYINY